MPRFDGTGPKGEGSKTGRGLGKCNLINNDKIASTQDKEEQSTLKKPWFGRGLGLARRNGRGFRNRGK